MNDKELLERAAKAAGIQVLGPARKWVASGVSDDDLLIRNDKGGDSVWNPLTNDGDALRLAVKVGFTNPGCFPLPHSIVAEQNAKGYELDWYYATRRAIVRAAAALVEGE